MEKIKYLNEVMSYWGLIILSTIYLSTTYILFTLGNLGASVLFLVMGSILLFSSLICASRSKKRYRKALVEDIAINGALLTILRLVKPKPKKKAKRKK